MSNPKSFYNQTDYNAGSSRTPVIHKPDEVSASDLLPPPPYSPEPTRKSSDSNYGSTEQQVGLLSQQSQPFPSKKKIPQFTPPPNNTSSSSSSTQDHTSIPMNPTYRRRNNGDPGCCRKWCKYLFAAILIWLVLLMYSDKIGLTPPSHAPPLTMCPNNAISWKELPRMTDFERNIEFILQGQVSSGRIVITPIEDRHGGTIFSDVQFTPTELNHHMTFQIEEKKGDTTLFIIQMPDTLSTKDCIHLNMEIRLPYSANLLHISASNVDVFIHPFVKDVSSVDIQTSNGKIELDRWSGEFIKLVTSNKDVVIGNLIAGGSIYIQNSNAEIQLAESIEAKDRIDIRNSNGLIHSVGNIIAENTIKIGSSNELLQLGNLVSDDIFVENANQPIRIKSIQSKVQVQVKTSNAPIDLNLMGEKNIKVDILTSSEPVNLHMTNEFEGQFVFSTSNGQVIIEDETDINYQDNLDYLKRGQRKRGKGDLTISTSNSDINVSFDI